MRPMTCRMFTSALASPPLSLLPKGVLAKDVVQATNVVLAQPFADGSCCLT